MTKWCTKRKCKEYQTPIFTHTHTHTHTHTPQHTHTHTHTHKDQSPRTERVKKIQKHCQGHPCSSNKHASICAHVLSFSFSHIHTQTHTHTHTLHYTLDYHKS